jgi:Ecdysteroid kinase-like family
MSDRSGRALPLKVEAIDAPWLTAALRTRAPGVTVKDFELVDVNHGTSTKLRLRLDLDELGHRAGIPAVVILKGGFEPHSFALPFMHENEARFYRDLQPALGLHAPDCYFADFDPETGQGIVIMEDLVARGVEFCDPLRPQGYDQVARRLSSLAAYHAQTWNSSQLDPDGRFGWFHPAVASLREYMQRFFEPEIWERFVRSPRGAAASVQFHDLGWAVGAVDRLVSLADRLPRCVVHGDTHLGNLYEDPDGTPGFFDSQPHQAPPMVEVTYHLTCALDMPDRRRWERQLVQHYGEELARHGVEAPELANLMLQFGVFQAYGYMIFLVNESEFQPEAVNTAYTARFSAAMLDHGTKELLESATLAWSS